MKSPDSPPLRDALASLSEEGDASDALDVLFAEAARLQATDLHLDPGPQRYHIRCRIDGRVHPLADLRREVGAALCRAIQVAAGIDPTGGSARSEGRHGKDLVVRVSSIESNRGSKVSLRLPQPDAADFDLAKLGMDEATLSPIEDLLATGDGLLLVAGCTGAGKTTTAYALLDRLVGRHRNVISLEDPAEQFLDHVTQVEIGRGAESFASGLRAALRHDPDVLFVGEIRDPETCAAAIDAALSGHLVISTVHSRDAVGAATCLRSLGASSYELGAALRGVIGQRLARRICADCARPSELGTEGERQLERLGIPIPDGGAWRSAAGCEACWQTGSRGLVGLFEPWLLGDADRSALFDELGEPLLRESARERGVVSLGASALNAAGRGQIAIGEALRIAAATSS